MNRSGHSWHKSHSQSVQCTRPGHCLSQQWRHNPIQLRDVTIATQRTLLRTHVNGAEIVLKSTDRRSNLSPFLYVQGLISGCLIVLTSRVIRLTVLTKNRRGDLKRRLSRVHYIVQCTVYNARWGNNALQTMLWYYTKMNQHISRFTMICREDLHSLSIWHWK